MIRSVKKTDQIRNLGCFQSSAFNPESGNRFVAIHQAAKRQSAVCTDEVDSFRDLGQRALKMDPITNRYEPVEFVASELPEVSALVLASGRPETPRLDELTRHATETLRL